MPYANPDERRESMRKYQRENRDKINAYNRARYAANPEPQKRATLNWRNGHRLHCNEKARLWIKANRKRLYDPNTPEGAARLAKESRRRIELRKRLKCEVLAHYGRGGKLRCCWPDCLMDDADMLTIDHVENNGAAHRKLFRTGAHFYRYLKINGFPTGYQTLCANHQFKKEALRRKAA